MYSLGCLFVYFLGYFFPALFIYFLCTLVAPPFLTKLFLIQNSIGKKEILLSVIIILHSFCFTKAGFLCITFNHGSTTFQVAVI